MKQPFLISKNIKIKEVEKAWIKGFKDDSNDNLENSSLVDHIMKELNEKISRAHNDHLEFYIKNNLASRGFEFSSQEDFYSFIKRRVRRVVFEELEEVHYYLDFVDLDDRGVQIGVTHENRVKFDFDHENMKVSATIGWN